MKYEIRCAVLTLLICSLHAKILRNNALMNKMVSHFQDSNLSLEPGRSKTRHGHDRKQKTERQEIQKEQDSPDRFVKEHIKDQVATADEKLEITRDYLKQPEKVLNSMQRVLCKNFPTIPCDIIMHDQTLSKLIERSIHQAAVKKMQMAHTTDTTEHNHPPTVFPLINSEELSNFLEVSNTGYFKEVDTPKKIKKKKKSGELKVKNHWSHERPSKKKLKGLKDSKRGTELYTGRKKMRKFYPHKVKYKDKKDDQPVFAVEEKTSMSAELPNSGLGILTPKSEGFSYKMELSDSPAWRIDYMKHGMPSLNMFEFEDGRIRGKLLKSQPGTPGMAANTHSVRKEVMHPDVIIKKSKYVRNIGKNSEMLD